MQIYNAIEREGNKVFKYDNSSLSHPNIDSFPRILKKKNIGLKPKRVLNLLIFI